MSVYMGNNKDASGRRDDEQQAENWFNSYNNLHNVKVYATEADKQRIKAEMFNSISAGINNNNIRQLRTTILRVAAVLVLATGAGLLTYVNRGGSAKQHTAAVTWQLFEATGASTRTLVLADSSTVALKPGSKISVPSNFNKTNRTAKLLNGEAFFEIKPNPAKPFVVQSGGFNIKVLGTAFTVKDDKAAGRKQVAVAHGKVQVSSGANVLSVLTKGQRIKYINATGKYALDTVTASMVGIWAKDQIELNHVPFAHLAQAFEAFYGQELVTRDGRINNSRFTLSIDKQQQASTTLKIIAKTHGLYFEEQDDKIVLTYQK